MNSRWILAMSLSSLAWISSLAQPPLAPAGPFPPAPRRGGEKPDGLTPEIEAFLKRLTETYQKAESYRDHGQAILVQQNGRVKVTTEMPMELSFKRPNLFLLDGGQYTTGSDGKILYFVVPSLGQYTAGRAPDSLKRQDLRSGSILGGVDEGHPELIDFLIRPDALKVWLSQVVKVGWKPDVQVGGIGCRVLTCETLQGAKLAVAVDTNRMVVLNVAAALTANPAAPGQFASPANGVTRLSYALGAVELNPQIQETNFAFKPPAGSRRVADFSVGGPGDFERPGEEKPVGIEGAHLLNKPVPQLGGRDLQGKPLAPAEIQEKVTLLFFWSLTGGEYCLVAIPVVQQVADHFKDRADVLILGIAADAEQKTVAQLLERKKASFRNLIDEGQHIQSSFQLGGVPSFVLVGADGLVKWARLGAPPSLKEDLVREIEKALPKTSK